MDEDIRYIIKEEQKLAAMLEEAEVSARARVEEHRSAVSERKESEFRRISSEYKSMTETKLQDIRNLAESELEALRSEQKHLLDDTMLLNKITGRIVSLILENRQ